MADKNDQNNPPSQGTATAAQPAPQTGSRGAPGSGASTRNAPQGKTLAASKRQYLIATRRADGYFGAGLLGFQPLSLEFLEQTLRSTPEVEFIETIKPQTPQNGFPYEANDGLTGSPAVVVARMPDDKAEIFRQQSRGQLIVEPDQSLHLLQAAAEPAMVTGIAAAIGPSLNATIIVLGKDNAPVKEAEVCLFGSVASATGLTDERGNVMLSLHGETPQSVSALYVKPKFDYWTFYQAQPALETQQPNLVYLRPLSESFPDFPRQQTMGWGQRLMRLDQVPGQYRGQGAKVAIIDSGVATSHVDLQRIRTGVDIVGKTNGAAGWNQDAVSHGSHAAGIIGAAESGMGIRGFAPEAEIHVCKLFPGGQIGQLVEAIEYCIENQIDVATLDLGATQPSEALEQEIIRAKRLGIALIAAAGNTGGPLEYPARSPHVLAVSAIGKWGEFPTDSYHARTIGAMDQTGLFSPRFTSYGSEVAVCAPGVAILSTVPPNNYALRDGTSCAAAHVAGVAALVVAHHPDFQGRFRMRNAERVDRLFAILKASAQPVNLGDPRRTGFGVPDVLIALGLAPRVSYSFHAVGQFPNPYSLYNFSVR